MVVRSTDQNGQTVDRNATLSGEVSAVNYAGGAPVLLLGGAEVLPNGVALVSARKAENEGGE